MREIVKDDMVVIEYPDLMVVRVIDVWKVNTFPKLIVFELKLLSGVPITATVSNFKVFEEFPENCVMGGLLVTGDIDAFI